MSSISARKSVPPLAWRILPTEPLRRALVKAPASQPKSSTSISVPGIEAQLTATKGWSARAASQWMARASSSLPVPVSPNTRIGMPRSSTRRTLPISALICGSPDSRSPKPAWPPCGLCAASPGRRSASAVPATSAACCWWADPAARAAPAAHGTGTGATAAAAVTSLQTGQLKRACRLSDRPDPVCTAIGVAKGERKRSTSAPTVVPSSDTRLCKRSAALDRPSNSSALRLAPTMRPSGETARMPSISVPMNSTRLWKCSRIELR